MKIVVLGAAGRTGLHLVNSALAKGHEVTAFIREAEKLEPKTNLRIVTGDARNEADLIKALQDQEAVVSALGSVKINDDLTVRSTKALVAAANKTGVKRVVMMSTFLITPNYKPNILVRLMMKLAKAMVTDRVNGEELLKASGLDWTIVHATTLDNIAPGGQIRIVKDDETVSTSNSIARADVAKFMLESLTKSETIHKSILITVK